MSAKTVDISALPRLLRQMVSQQIDRCNDLSVFDDASLGSTRPPDAYLLAEGVADDRPLDLLIRQPDCSVVQLSESADRFTTYELRLHVHACSDASMAELIELLRASIARRLSRVPVADEADSATAANSQTTASN